jgi:hypothetical protein
MLLQVSESVNSITLRWRPPSAEYLTQPQLLQLPPSSIATTISGPGK